MCVAPASAAPNSRCVCWNRKPSLSCPATASVRARPVTCASRSAPPRRGSPKPAAASCGLRAVLRSADLLPEGGYAVRAALQETDPLVAVATLVAAGQLVSLEFQVVAAAIGELNGHLTRSEER